MDKHQQYSERQEDEMFLHLWEKGSGPAYIKDYEDESLYLEMPLVALVHRLMERCAENMPLTPAGNPKRTVVAELYALGPKDFLIEKGYCKLGNLDSSLVLSSIWDLSHWFGLFRKYKDTLRLTKLGKEILGHPKALTHHLFKVMQDFADTSHLDCFPFEAYNDSLELVAVLLDEYGDTFRPTDFYAGKYCECNPFFEDDVSDEKSRRELYYSFYARVLDRFFSWFGLVEFDLLKGDVSAQRMPVNLVRRTPLFEKFIGINPPEGGREFFFPMPVGHNRYKS